MRAIQITEYGGPEVLTLVELPDPEPAAGEVLLDVTAAGINYADTHHTENSYLTRTRLPFVPGAEAAGTTADGRRVVALVGDGGYAEKATAPEALTFDVPEGLDDGAALALVLQGTTAWFLLRDSAHLEEGESVVVHAAAGGVGTLAVQLAKAWGAGRVIATASTQEKRDLALELGADAAVDPAADNLRGALIDANDGRPLDIVLEMVGGPVFDASLAALAPFGRLVVFGNASRTPPTPLDPGALVRPSRAVVGYWLVNSLRKPERFARVLGELFDMVAAGTLAPVVGGSYPLSEARRAHEDLLARTTTGKLVLRPGS
jgi:NADPH:quinone reductase